MYYIYKFIGHNNQILYVGRSVNLPSRLDTHANTGLLNSDDVKEIQYAQCKTKSDSYIYEIYYIALHDPELNSKFKTYEKPSFELPELEFTTFNEFRLRPKRKEVKENTFKEDQSEFKSIADKYR